MKVVAPLLALVTAAVAFAAPASADDLSVQADLNGDGQLDTVAVQPVAGHTDQQRLVATVNGAQITAIVPLNNSPQDGVVKPLRVVDLDGDGWDEVIVTEAVGANTDWFSAWGLFGGLNPVVGPDLNKLVFFEGGGLAAINRYGCEAGQFVTVSAFSDDFQTYQGERVMYAVHNGVATEVSNVAVVGPRSDPAFQLDAQSCAS